MNKVPRYWPVLGILSETGKLEGYQRLLFLLYHLSREVSDVSYLFSLPCLESAQLRTDVRQLVSQGLLSTEFHRIWSLEITRRGRNSYARIREDLPQRWLKLVRKLVQEKAPWDYLRLREELFNSEESLLRQRNLVPDARLLLQQLENFPPSHNLLLLEGSLDYVLAAEERSRKAAQKRVLISALSCYVERIQRVYHLCADSVEALGEMDLRDLMEEFVLLEKSGLEMGILTPVEERHDLTAFAEVWPL